jgi:hypothetical protein
LERSEEKEQDLGEKVYEGSTGGEAEEDETERRLKGREERILEMKLRREQVDRLNSSRFDIQLTRVLTASSTSSGHVREVGYYPRIKGRTRS